MYGGTSRLLLNVVPDATTSHLLAHDIFLLWSFPLFLWMHVFRGSSSF